MAAKRGRPTAAPRPGKWQDRIVGSGTEAADQLLANPLNYRIHSHLQEQALGGVLDQVGWVRRVLVNKRTGHVVDGHLRVGLALERGEPVPVDYIDVSAAEEKVILATLDPVGTMAGADRAKLRDLVADLELGGNAAMQDVLNGLTATTQQNPRAVVMEQAIQLQPAREYIVVICGEGEAGAVEFETLREAFGLGLVRRGGYKRGSAFDDIGVERVVPAATVIARCTPTKRAKATA